MPSQDISKLIYRVRQEQKILKIGSILCVVAFTLMVWRDFGSLQESLERITEIEREESLTSDIFRLWILTDVSSLFKPLGILLFHILATGASVLAAIYFFAERKTQLLLALADDLNQKPEPVGTGQPM